MKVFFWGARGSLPAAANTLNLGQKIFEALKRSRGRTLSRDDDIREFVEKELPFSVAGFYGANTSCVEITGGTEHVICDAGTGIRDLSRNLWATGTDGADVRPRIFNIFISHLHWDHIQGFPFFMQSYAEGNRIVVHGCHPYMKRAFLYQHKLANIRLPFKADIRFHRLEPGRQYDIAGFCVQPISQNHPGDSYGYRFQLQGKSVVYSTDCEHFEEVSEDDYRFVDFFRGADVLIIDAQYPLLDALSVKENWGHSNNMVAVELGVRAGVKRLCLFHSEPTVDDMALEVFLDGTRRYLEIYDPESSMTVDLAYDGMEIEV
ncbi:MAG: MBL fold metallo-hydrolase [Synergistaceae bacterium]|nr:MBL fold metallo-hydrolase [Synergistaceae bacterium]